MVEASQNRTKFFLGVFAALGALTAISFAVANSPIMENPRLGWAIMMLISVSKAMLVVLFFMHLRWETHWKYVLTIPAAIMSLVLVLILVPDVVGRTESYSRQRQLHAPNSGRVLNASESESQSNDDNSH